MSRFANGYLIRDEDDWANPGPHRAISILYPLHGTGLSDAQDAARDRSRGGKPQVIVKIAGGSEAIIEQYADGSRRGNAMTGEQRRAAQIELASLTRADDGTMTAPADSILMCAYCTQPIAPGERFTVDTDGDTCHPRCLEQARGHIDP